VEYHIALAPDLGVSSQDFVAEWNEAPECRALAQAQLIPHPPQDFPLDPQLLQHGLVLLSGAAGAVGVLALDALKDAVKERLTDYFRRRLEEAVPTRRPIKVESIRQPGGAYLLVVTEAGQ
jgi:hypothetical protein